MFKFDIVMLVATLNTWKNDGKYDDRIALSIQQAKVLNPDVFLLQEVFSSDNGEFNTVKTIAEGLNKKYYHTKARVKNRKMNGKELRSSAGLGIITDLPVKEHLSVDLPTNAQDGGRKAQTLVVEHEDGAIAFVNLHLSHIRGASDLRLEQMEAILDQEILMDCEHIILAGDFNATADMPEMVWLKEHGFSDCFEDCGGQAKGTSPLKNNERKAIDFILIKSTSKTCSSANIVFDTYDSIKETYASDHLGISALIE